MIKGETSVLRVQSYTTVVYGRIAPCAIAYGRTRLSRLYNLMNSKYFNLFYFILFILGHNSKYFNFFLLILGHFESTVQ